MDSLLIYNSCADPYGTHLLSCKQIQSVCTQLGIRSVIYDCSSSIGLENIKQALNIGNIEFIHAEQTHFIETAQKLDLVEDLQQTPIIIQCRDPWFQPWIYNNLKTLHSNSVVYHMEKTSILNLQSLRSNHTLGYNSAHVISPTFKPLKPLNGLNKLITFVGSAQNPKRIMRELTNIRPHLKDIAEYYCNLDKNQLQIPASFWNPSWKSGRTNLLGKYINLEDYSLLYKLVRFKVRSNFLNICNRFHVALCISGDWIPESSGNAKIIYSRTDLHTTHQIMSNSKYTLSDQAGLDFAVGDRVSTCIYSGIPLICRNNNDILVQVASSNPNCLLYNTHRELEEVLAICSEKTFVNKKLDNIAKTLIPKVFLPETYIRSALNFIGIKS